MDTEHASTGPGQTERSIRLQALADNARQQTPFGTVMSDSEEKHTSQKGLLSCPCHFILA